jgi:thiaminase/transcriptional activator TenA
VPVALLPSQRPDEWRAATSHPFLDGIRDGSLPAADLDRWLVQDALFVADLLRFQARLLARAPRPAQAALVTGLVGLVEELTWFEEQAAGRGIDLAAAPAAATERYAALLERLDAAPPSSALAALWVLERVYLDAWTSAAPGAGPYAAFVEHWTTPAFTAYVASLEQAADTLLADPLLAEGEQELDPLLGEVLAAEAAFWGTSRGDGPPPR